MFADYYQILDISLSASDIEIKVAFKKQALIWHPDRNPGKDTIARMQLINEAYLILKDNEARVKYNLEYQKFKNRLKVKPSVINDESNYINEDYNVEDDILKKWIENAKKQAVDLAKQTIEDFKNIAATGVKAAVKKSGQQLVLQIMITIIAIILFSIIGKCFYN